MIERFPRVATQALAVSLGIASLTACGAREGAQPNEISSCTPDTNSGIPAVPGSGVRSENPQSVLDHARDKGYRDKSNKSNIRKDSDKINGLGEIVCAVIGDDGKAQALFFLKDNIRVRDDLAHEDQVDVDKVMTEVSEYQATTTTVG